ncbi:GNAT family N-acetyltransferase [Pyruvatibacter mobilis]|uniref:GNAT family N-acetyltransferase n=1 Tax=Pyruvatibacter mobilis TaxID=1712261 RepID=UPI003BA91665
MALISDHPTDALSFRDAAWPAETAGNPRFATRWLTHEDAAGPQRNAWRELAANASEPNPFYEDHLLLPALQHLSGNTDIRLLAIEDRLEPGRLIAFLPVKVSHTCRGLPLPTATAWRSIHTFLATPLIRKGCEWDGMRAIVRSLRQAGLKLIRMPHMAADGPVAEALSVLTSTNSLAVATSRSFERALLKSGHDGESYIAESVSKKKRKEYARQSRRLADLGEVTFETADMCDEAAVEGIALEFLELELASWKGRAGTAIAQRPAEARFFFDACRAAAAAGKLFPLTMRVDGAPVATILNFGGSGSDGTGQFSFKIAHDESYARYSPGVLLELELTRRLLDTPGIAFTDSCANPDHPMIDHLWRERRAMQDVTVATSKFVPSAAVRWAAAVDRTEISAKRSLRAIVARIKRSA